VSLSFGNAVHGTSNPATSQAVTLTYSAGSIIICDICANTGPVTSVVSSALGAFTRHTGTGGGQATDRWYLVAASAQTSDTITVTQSGSNFICVDAYEWKGVNTSSPWDAGGPVVNASPDPQSITTVNANAAVIAFFRESSTATPTAGSGFTQISGANFQLTEYKILSSTQTLSCTQTTGAGNSNGLILDALVADSGGGYVPYDPWPQSGPILSQRRMLGWLPSLKRRSPLWTPSYALLNPARSPPAVRKLDARSARR